MIIFRRRFITYVFVAVVALTGATLRADVSEEAEEALKKADSKLNVVYKETLKAITRSDARKDPAWRERVLQWYSRPSSQSLPTIGGAADVHGVRDLNGVVWEWVDDFNALLVGSDSRDQDGADKMKFCGAGAVSMQEKENYATLMRIAMLSALKAVDTTNNMGFRCAKPD